MNKYTITPSEFKNLLQYYISCIKEETILSISFDVSKEGEKFHSDIITDDELFTYNKKIIQLKKTEKLQRLIDKQKESNKNLYYGYPVFIDHRGNISPILYSKIQIQDEGEQVTLITTEDKPEFNHYILLANGFEYEEITLIREEIEKENDTSKKINRITDALNLKNKEILLREEDQQKIIKNKVIIYLDERSHITHNLILELQKLKKLPFQQIKASGLRTILHYENNKKNENKVHTKSILEIYPCNYPQEQAIRKALTDSLTVITGPPGTGKSQVVINIIANAVYQNKTVLFASRNNKAVDVVTERLNALLPYQLIIRMGAQEYRRETREKIESTIKSIMKEQKKKQKPEAGLILDFNETNHTIKTLYDKLEEMSTLNTTIDQHQSDIDKLIEQIPLDFYNIAKDHHHNIKQEVLTRYLDVMLHKGLHRRLLHRLLSRYYKKTQEKHTRILHRSLPPIIKEYIEEHNLHDKVENYINIARSLLIIKDIEALKKKIHKKKKELLSYPSFSQIQKEIDKTREKRVALSRDIIIQHWLNKFHSKNKSIVHYAEEYVSASEKLEEYADDHKDRSKAYNKQYKNLRKLLEVFPVWVVTNLSVKNSLPLKNNLFDILIIDEASQCDIPSVLPLLYRAKQVVIIGDPNQLKHISLIKKSKDKNLTTKNNIERLQHDFSYTRNSCYDCAEHTIIKKHGKPLLLNKHYRCHPDIIEFSNQYFYDDQLEIQTNTEKLVNNKEINPGVTWINTQGETIPAKSPYNEEEIKKVTSTLLELSKSNNNQVSYGVVTLFRAQMERIIDEINKYEQLKNMNITVGTAHRFQGDEKDMIIFSLALSKGVKKTTLNWVHSTSQLLNVAITRAKTRLVIIGDKKTCYQAHGLLSELVRYIDQKQQLKEDHYNSKIKEEFYKICRDHGLTLKTNHTVKIRCNGKVKYYNLDFVLRRNNKKYCIEIKEQNSLNNENEMEKRLRQNLLREKGWSIREYTIQDPSQIRGLIEEIERYC
jgi:hypothetical protein